MRLIMAKIVNELAQLKAENNEIRKLLKFIMDTMAVHNLVELDEEKKIYKIKKVSGADDKKILHLPKNEEK